jgi:hypothetical protein
MGDLVRDFWWLAFPLAGMAMAGLTMMQTERRKRALLGMVKSYIDQGKEPPAELVRAAMKD